MQHILTSEQYNDLIVEEISMKRVMKSTGKFLDDYILPNNKIARWALVLYISLSFGLRLTPQEAKSGFLANYITFRVKNLESMDDRYGPIKNAKEIVIRKIEQSKILKNKVDLIERVKKCPIKIGNTFFSIPAISKELDGAEAMFFNLGELMGGEHDQEYDFILVNMETGYDLEHILVHELNHLVQNAANEKYNQNVTAHQLLKDISESEYMDFYKDWKNVDEEADSIFKRTDISMGVTKFIWDNIMENKDYYLGDHEVYVCISNLKNFCVKNGLMEFDEDITQDIIHKIRDYANNIEDVKEYVQFRERDFMYVLPFIDWNKCEELNLIAQSKNVNIDNLA